MRAFNLLNAERNVDVPTFGHLDDPCTLFDDLREVAGLEGVHQSGETSERHLLAWLVCTFRANRTLQWSESTGD